MTLLGIVGTAAATAIRMQTGVRLRVAARVAAAMQLREGAAPLVADIALVSTAAGDIPDGGARDSTLEFRATIATGSVCHLPEDDAETLWITPLDEGVGRTPVAGDSVWLYVAPDAWIAAAVSRVDHPAVHPPVCAPGVGEPRPFLLAVPAVLRTRVPLGVPASLTRLIRYSFYRAADGDTYLGLREWSYASGALAVVQPVAGPFDRLQARFIYFDSTGAELPRASTPPNRIAAVGVHMGGVSLQNVRGSTPPAYSLMIALRNRR